MKKILLIALSAAAIMTGCKTLPAPGTANMSNPAADYCVQHGGTHKITTNKDGSQAGVCEFDNGSQCDAWAFKRGTCTKENNAPIVY
ncbi:DUF333 domain-containing protein [Photobacterium kishitanii]|uniref:putative hemolysin n=1 Tax=Photobacterium kishitanii TaxID=318456 RepID=UPI000D161DED|nr:DUF333 domain-containing protein [Photobacterium kishitanii]PSU91609.1 DUF333 domain-containing protein [Photobacterium kishitanii]